LYDNLAASNRQWATAGTVFSEARSRGIIAGKERERREKEAPRRGLEPLT